MQTAVVTNMLKIHRWLGTYRKINYIFLTEFNRNKFDGLIDIHADNVFIKPNFVYAQDVSPSAPEMKTKFVYAGRLDENKGIAFLLEAWSMLPKEYKLHIYGDGKFREACEAAAQEHENIRFLGFRPRQEIQEDLMDAAALVFPSIWHEGYPMIIAESFSAGRPVLAANLGNHGHLIQQSQGGVVYEPDCKEAFCCAAKKIVANNPLYSENARKYYTRCLSEKCNYEMLSEIYDRAKHIC
jgi:glycosyltransferase involved in cell wall biosynthesis